MAKSQKYIIALDCGDTTYFADGDVKALKLRVKEATRKHGVMARLGQQMFFECQGTKEQLLAYLKEYHADPQKTFSEYAVEM